MNKITSLFILTLFLFSFVNCSLFSNILSDDLRIDSSLAKSMSTECIEEEKNSEYSKCLPEMSINNYKQTCLDINSEKCQNFYNDPDKTKYFPICSKNPLYNEYLQPLIVDYIKNILESQCYTDEKDNLCPYAIYAITNTGHDVLNDNCKSKKCTELLLESYKKINIDQLSALDGISTIVTKINYDQINTVKKMIPFLESDQCKSAHVTSDSISTKINYFLLIILSLLLVFVFH